MDVVTGISQVDTRQQRRWCSRVSRRDDRRAARRSAARDQQIAFQTKPGLFGQVSRTSHSAIDAAQAHARYEQRLGIGAQLGDSSVHRTARRCVRSNVSWPSELGRNRHASASRKWSRCFPKLHGRSSLTRFTLPSHHQCPCCRVDPRTHAMARRCWKSARRCPSNIRSKRRLKDSCRL